MKKNIILLTFLFAALFAEAQTTEKFTIIGLQDCDVEKPTLLRLSRLESPRFNNAKETAYIYATCLGQEQRLKCGIYNLAYPVPLGYRIEIQTKNKKTVFAYGETPYINAQDLENEKIILRVKKVEINSKKD